MKITFLGSLLLLAAAAATADEPPQDAARREQLKLERAAIQQNYTQRQAACRDTFAVTDCLKKARLDMQASMKHVHEQELALNDAARARRAAATADRLNAKAAAANARPDSASAPTAGAAPASAASRPASRKRSTDFDGLPKPATPRSAQDEAQARERYEARQREIRDHREEVRLRNAEKAKKTPAAPPLPVPTAASAAAGG